MAEVIIDRPIEEAFSEAYSIYGASVLISRAIPSLEDGLTPVNRRILYTFHKENISGFKKAAYYTGVTVSMYHPHGDLSLYDSMVGLSQWWKNQVNFIEAQGNNGTLQGKPYAAQRYLELKLSSFSKDALFDNIEKEIVDYEDNYDKSAKIAVTLPSKFPVILNSGMMGIGSAYATDIPIHAVSDICRTAIAKIDDPSLDSKALAKVLKGPDFPTGGEIINAADLPKIYEAGNGVIRVRGVIEEGKREGKEVLIIKEIPPKLTTGKIVEEITALCREKEEGKKKVPGLLQDKVSDIKDFSAKKDVEIVVYPKRGVSLPVLKNLIFENTSMTYSHKYMMNVLADGKFTSNAPLDFIVQGWIDYRRRTVRRLYIYLIGKTLERITILKALIKANKDIDAIIALIKKSSDKEGAKQALMKKYAFAEKEATYIVEQQLYKLSGLEIDKLQKELKEKQEEASNYEEVLKDAEMIDAIIKDELETLVKKHDVKRKTKLLNVGKMEVTDLIEEEDLLVAITTDGYVFSTPVHELKDGNKGNKGQLLIDSKRNKVVEKSVVLNSHDKLFVFTEDGKLFVAHAFQLNVNNVHLSNVIDGLGSKRIASLVPVTPDDKGDLVFVTSSSLTKRVPLEECRPQRMPADGLLVVALEGDETLVSVVHAKDPENDVVVLTTSRGYASKILVSKLPLQRRPSMGRKMIRLKEKGERCVAAVPSSVSEEDSSFVLFITTKGKGKMVKISDLLYKKTESGQGASFLAIKLYPEDKLCKTVGIRANEQVIITAKSNKTIKIVSEQVATLGRQAKGSTIMKLNEDDEISSITVVNI
jgi:DNA gyrase subunit A